MTYATQLAAIGVEVDDSIARLTAVAEALNAQFVSTQAALAAVPPEPPTAQLAAFYKPIANRPALPLVILTHNDEPARDARTDDGLVVMYVLGCEIEGPSTCPAPSGYSPFGNSVGYDGGFCANVNPHEDWFLHNSAGARIRGGSDSRRSYHMNPGSTGWQQYAAGRMVTLATTYGWRAVFLDNVELGWAKTRTQSTGSDGTIKEYATEAAWRAAWLAYLKVVCDALHAAGVTVYGNMIADANSGTSWNVYLDSLDGGMFEGWYPGYSEASASSLANQLAQAEWALRRGKTILCVGQGAQGDTDRMRRALAAYLLIAEPGAHFRYTQSGHYGEWWDYPEYALALGNPLGPRTQSAPGVWQRAFQHGVVQLDANARTASITQQEDH